MKRIISLNGKWDFMPLYEVDCCTDLPSVLSFEDEKVVVPSIWNEKCIHVREDFTPFVSYGYPDRWNEAKTGVLRTFIDIKPEDGRRYFLKFNGVGQKWAAYIDGEKIIETGEMWLPQRFEITDRVGTKLELCVVCTSFPKFNEGVFENKYHDLAGSWYGCSLRGIWQEVEIEDVPEKYITDISYDTKGGMLSVEVKTEETCPVTVSVAGITVSGNTNEVLKAGYGDVKLWDVDEPNLYTMTVKTETDERELKIGFREMEIRGRDFYLNGKRINLRGDSWHFQGLKQQTKEYAKNWFRVCRRNGANYVRLHAEPHPEYYLDAADEVGILLVSETAIYGSSNNMNASSPEFIENCRRHSKALVERDKNHPSVVVWSLQNEMRWVSGRDVYKTYIGELIGIMKDADLQKRAVFIEGDNRLYPKSEIDIESYHYNIDGTIGQWDRTRPLTYGEHGGWWYICPQNSSMYQGLSAYEDVWECGIGLGEKERLFIEYARRYDVGGVSTFNFAHYFGTAFPEKDISVGDRIIPKNSLTVNNGELSDYPMNIPNVTCTPVAAAYKEATVIPSEYDRVFYEGKTVTRQFDVYNDTRYDADVKLCFSGASEKVFEFRQECGFRKTVSLDVTFPDVGEYPLKIELFHNGKLMHSGEVVYKAVESGCRIETGKSVAFFGSDRDFEVINSFVACTRCESLSDIDCDVLILGTNLPGETRDMQGAIELFVRTGGVCVVLEQDVLAFGDLSLSRQGFFGVHANDLCHPVMNGLSDEDLRMWHPYTNEGMPLDIVNNAFTKPAYGDINMILECSKGDFCDGGDLWTPLFEAGVGSGKIIFNQVELVSNLEKCPVSAKLLANILNYAISVEPKQKSAVMTVDIRNPEDVEKAKAFDGTVIVLPTADEKKLSELVGAEVTITDTYTYQLKKTGESFVTAGISRVDLFGYHKPGFSPRPTRNYRLAENSIEIAGGENLLMSITHNPFEDYYINGYSAEYCKMALINLHKENAAEPLPYLVKYGKFVVSQIAVIPETKRIYDRLLANCGASVMSGVFSEAGSGRNGAVEYIMTLPLKSDFELERAYFTDPVYSLNNLGEGVYGWMKKLESDDNGFLTIPESAGKIHFVTFFAEAEEELESTVSLDVNCKCELYVKGVLSDKTAKFHKGINPVALVLYGDEEDMSFRLEFGANYSLRYSVTVDYVDAK